MAYCAMGEFLDGSEFGGEFGWKENDVHNDFAAITSWYHLLPINDSGTGLVPNLAYVSYSAYKDSLSLSFSASRR